MQPHGQYLTHHHEYRTSTGLREISKEARLGKANIVVHIAKFERFCVSEPSQGKPSVRVQWQVKHWHCQLTATVPPLPMSNGSRSTSPSKPFERMMDILDSNSDKRSWLAPGLIGAVSATTNGAAQIFALAPLGAIPATILAGADWDRGVALESLSRHEKTHKNS